MRGIHPTNQQRLQTIAPDKCAPCLSPDRQAADPDSLCPAGRREGWRIFDDLRECDAVLAGKSNQSGLILPQPLTIADLPP